MKENTFLTAPSNFGESQCQRQQREQQQQGPSKQPHPFLISSSASCSTSSHFPHPGKDEKNFIDSLPQKFPSTSLHVNINNGLSTHSLPPTNITGCSRRDENERENKADIDIIYEKGPSKPFFRSQPKLKRKRSESPDVLEISPPLIKNNKKKWINEWEREQRALEKGKEIKKADTFRSYIQTGMGHYLSKSTKKDISCDIEDCHFKCNNLEIVTYSVCVE